MRDIDYWQRMLSLYTEETIPKRQTLALPAPLRKARNMEKKRYSYLDDAALFYKEGMLLADYEDNTVFTDVRSLYCPTYYSLDDRELRGYFGWRTRLRAGHDEDAPLTYLFIYIYELLNNIGVASPRDGYARLLWVTQHYGDRNPKILLYMQRWLYDYVLYYDLPVELLPKRPEDGLDRALIRLSEAATLESAEIMETVKVLGPYWLQRSRFYAENSADMDEVIVGVLRGYVAHFIKYKAQATILTALFGNPGNYYYDLLYSAVFYKKPRSTPPEYRVNSVRKFTFNGTMCSQSSFTRNFSGKKLVDLTKYIDSQMRKAAHDPHRIQEPKMVKWVMKLVDDEIAALYARKNAAKASAVKPIVFNTSDLERIRTDAAVTQARLAIADEMEEEVSEAPAAPAAPEESPTYGGLTAQETRYLRALLCVEDTGWVRAEGLLPSVLADGINDKLYEEFGDTVLATDGEIAVLEDYADELKEALSL